MYGESLINYFQFFSGHILSNYYFGNIYLYLIFIYVDQKLQDLVHSLCLLILIWVGRISQPGPARSQLQPSQVWKLSYEKMHPEKNLFSPSRSKIIQCSLSLSICLHLYNIYLYMISVYIYIYVYTYTYIYIYLPIYLSTNSSIYLLFYLPIYISIYISIYIYLPYHILKGHHVIKITLYTILFCSFLYLCCFHSWSQLF